MTANRQAHDAIKLACSLFEGSKSTFLGGLFGNDQNGLPSLLSLSIGYVWSNYNI
jgi:hypothetical protein